MRTRRLTTVFIRIAAPVMFAVFAAPAGIATAAAEPYDPIRGDIPYPCDMRDCGPTIPYPPVPPAPDPCFSGSCLPPRPPAPPYCPPDMACIDPIVPGPGLPVDR